jgi:hypothetical protein
MPGKELMVQEVGHVGEVAQADNDTQVLAMVVAWPTGYHAKGLCL